MAFKSIEKILAYQREYREKNKEKLTRQHKEYYQKNREELRRWNKAYNATHKAVRAAYRASHKEERDANYQKNKEEHKRKRQEYYQKNKEAIIQRTKKYHLEHREWKKKYHKDWYARVRKEVLVKIDPDMKCARCGCDDTRFLEVNHIKGGGRKEQSKLRNDNHNMILQIYNRKRGIEDLNLLCRACNSVDHLERVYGHSGLRVVWDKPVINTPVSN